MPRLQTSFAFAADTDLTQLLEKVSVIGMIVEQEVLKDKFQYLDTFDWQLYKKGRVCMRRGVDLYTLSYFSGSAVTEGTGPETHAPLGREFVSTPLADDLVPLLGIRALIPCADIERKKRFFHLLNKDEKIILRFCLELNSSFSEGTAQTSGGCIRLYGLRGYEKNFHRLRQLLTEKGLQEGCGEDLLLRQVLAGRKRQPLDYNSKFNIALDDRESISEAARDIFLLLADDMALNIPGIIQDWDSEFLHDFRVALRRSRSLLSSLKKMMPMNECADMLAGLKAIGTASGPVRDLDVYLLEQEAYQALLPESLHQGLKEFFASLAAARDKEFVQLTQALQSPEYEKFMSQWLDFIHNRLCSLTGTGGQQPCRKAAAKLIRKRLEKILHAGEAISGECPDEELHKLRIQCKKLRYLLEFYRSLFPEKAMAACIAQLKKIQDNLGTFNDLSVQQEMLSNYHEHLTPGSKKNMHIAASLGGLITHLQNDQQKVRKKIGKTYSHFATAENRALFHDMLDAPVVRVKRGETK
ncbi:MAG: CHAD domain-containing protein [Proteobacteria bacterium]|nr:CHAD domain-containing protein [Pseudomonadota bacterium]MBU1420678.1 CHAD domain-containing protein [Pseudomonadota bacterium]MBU1454595.1 CHAD domain-containing protein [Pseudomonadota bacterium]